MATNVSAGAESSASGVHWTAIFGGAFTMAGISIILAPLGAALGLAASASWPSASSDALTAGTAAWLILVQWIASALGGYLTGRLRTAWTGAHTHEVFFRDTVHGFLAWAVSAVAGALILGATAATHNANAGNASPWMGEAHEKAASMASAATEASIILCISLLVGAFIASAAGALGGAHRDLHYATGSLKG